MYLRWSTCLRQSKLWKRKRKHLLAPHSSEPSNRDGSHAVGAACKRHLAAILSARPSVESQTAEASSHDAVHVRSCCFSAQLARRSMTLQYWGLAPIPPSTPPPSWCSWTRPWTRAVCQCHALLRDQRLVVGSPSAVGLLERSSGVSLHVRRGGRQKRGKRWRRSWAKKLPESTSYVVQQWAQEVEGIRIISSTGHARVLLFKVNELYLSGSLSYVLAYTCNPRSTFLQIILFYKQNILNLSSKTVQLLVGIFWSFKDEGCVWNRPTQRSEDTLVSRGSQTHSQPQPRSRTSEKSRKLSILNRWVWFKFKSHLVKIYVTIEWRTEGDRNRKRGKDSHRQT